MTLDGSKTSQYSEHEYVEGSINNSWSNMIGFIPRGSRVLDVGCSSGHLGATLIRLLECEVVGIDVNEADVRVARERLTEAYVLDVGEPDALAGLGEFDIVVFADVLEHLTDPVSALTAVRAVLGPAGALVYSIPNMTHASVRIDLLEGRFRYTETGLLDTTHLRFYDRHEVVEMLSSGGFGITDTADVVSTYPWELVRDRLAPLGLVVAPDFLDRLGETDGHVYQFVGRAVPSDAGPTDGLPPDAHPSTDEILAYARYFLDENERLRDEDANLRQIRTLENDIAALNGEIRDRDVRLSAADAALDRIRHHPVRSAAGALRRRLRSR